MAELDGSAVDLSRMKGIGRPHYSGVLSERIKRLEQHGQRAAHTLLYSYQIILHYLVGLRTEPCSGSLSHFYSFLKCKLYFLTLHIQHLLSAPILNKIQNFVRHVKCCFALKFNVQILSIFYFPYPKASIRATDCIPNQFYYFRQIELKNSKHQINKFIQL